MSDAFDLDRTPACVRMEDDLAEAVRIVREGGDLASALPALAAHIKGCSRCTELLAELVGEPGEWPDVSVDPVDPDQLFERALLGGLSAPESLVRSRAADRLGGLDRPGPAVLGALAGRARRDPDEDVRGAALKALNRLDREVSIPDRLIDAWAATLSEAPFIAGILERLAESPLQSVLGFGARRPHRSGLLVAGQGNIRGSLEGGWDELWLRLAGLPGPFERTRPVVALPTALAEQVPLTWAGEQPGLVPASSPVADGALHVVLGRGATAEEGPFRRMYLLNPELRAASGWVDKF